MPRPQRIYWWTVAFWAVSAIAHLVWFLVAVDALPPTDEVYTRLVGFQLAAFAVTKFPYWLGGLLVILVAEFVIFGRARRDAQFRKQ